MIHGPLSDLLLDGRYRVGELIGSGGFGHVYAAMHVGLEGKVAIKIPRIDDIPARAIPEAIAKFLEEGRTLKRLRHPNLAAALDVALLPVDADGLALPYLVLEWCDGPTLKEWRAERPGWMPPAQVWSVLRPAFEALAHAHDEGVAHRDIKPANILIESGRNGEPIPRVIDFGIAKIVGAAEEAASGATRTTSASRSFTPKYAAPEQLLGMRTGPWTDTYALALILLEMVMGRQVFPSDEDARRAVVESDPPTPRRLGLDLGPWDAVLERALSPRPADRHLDVRSFMLELDSIGAAGAAGAAVPWKASAESGARSAEQQGARPGGAVRPLGPRQPGRPADDSVVPSSHTMRTSSTGTGKATGAPGRRIAVVIAALALTALLAAAGIAAFRLDWLRRPTPISSASSEPPRPAGPPASLRPLATMTMDELDARVTAGGMRGCLKTLGAPLLMLTCSGGYVQLVDKSGGMPPNLDDIRQNQLHEAKLAARSYGAARYTNDGAWTLIVTTSTSLADDVVGHVVDGFRHDAIGTEATALERFPVPAKLSMWTGRELAQRVTAAGGLPTWEGPNGSSGRSVTFLVGTESANLQIFEGDPEMWLAATRGGAPHAYAVDGNNVLMCYATGTLGSVEFLKKILGNTSAARFGHLP